MPRYHQAKITGISQYGVNLAQILRKPTQGGKSCGDFLLVIRCLADVRLDDTHRVDVNRCLGIIGLDKTLV